MQPGRRQLIGPIRSALEASNADRLQNLVRSPWTDVQSPFTFLRGSAAAMVCDLTSTPTHITVQARGDCHFAQLLAMFSHSGRNLLSRSFNDFDETIPARGKWELSRLAASL